MASNSKSEDQGTIPSTFNFGEPVIASTSGKVDQDTTPSPFKLGDLVLARLKQKAFLVVVKSSGFQSFAQILAQVISTLKRRTFCLQALLDFTMYNV